MSLPVKPEFLPVEFFNSLFLTDIFTAHPSVHCQKSKGLKSKSNCSLTNTKWLVFGGFCGSVQGFELFCVCKKTICDVCLFLKNHLAKLFLEDHIFFY